MPKVRTLVPLMHPTTDEEFPLDTVVDVADDVAAAWKAAGKVSLIADEERNAQAATHYSDVVGREHVGQTPVTEPLPGPQAAEPPKRSGKK